jgi:outer membrane protein assembly factor BamB
VAAIPDTAGKALFVDHQGRVVKTLEVGAPVNDVAVDDVDRDGQYEIMVARGDSRLDALNADGGRRFSFAPERQIAPNSQLQIASNPALHVFVVDRDGKSAKTICVTTGDQRLHGLSANGEPLWRFHSYAGFFTRYGMYDLDGDGVKEIVGGNGDISDTDTLYFLDGRDAYAKRILNDGWGSAVSSMVIADINGDSREEIVIGTRRGTLHAIDPTQKGRLWSHKLGDAVRGCELVTGRDGEPLIVAGSLSGFVIGFDGAGDKQWVTAVGGPVAFMAVAGAGDTEAIIAALESGDVAALTRAGRITHRLRLPSRPTALATAGDRHQLILVAGENGAVQALAR